MGIASSKEGALLDALYRNDVRKLREPFQNGLSSDLLLTPLTLEMLEAALTPQPGPVQPPQTPVSRYEPWVGSAPIHVAADRKDTKILSAMLNLLKNSEHLEINVRDSDGYTAMGRAVKSAYINAVKLLIHEGQWDVNETFREEDGVGENQNWSLVRYCAANGLADVLQVLLEKGAEVSEWGKDGRRPIHLAVEEGHLECVRVLLDWDRRNGETRQRGVTNVARYIVRECTVSLVREDRGGAGGGAGGAGAGARGGPRGGEGEGGGEGGEGGGDGPLETTNDVLNALQVALRDAVRGLGVVVGRAQAHRSNRDRGAGLLHLACSNDKPNVLEYLLNSNDFKEGMEEMNDSGKTPIFMAIRHGSLECLKLLVKAGANVEAKDIENWTALHEAVKAGDEKLEILKYLIDECKVDVNSVDDDGWTALHVAARFSATEAVQILVNAGCEVNAKTEDNETAVLLASAQESSAEVLRQLLKNGADLSLYRDTALTPSRLILGRKDFGQLCILLDHINTLEEEERLGIMEVLESRSETGDTLLHVCVLEQNIEAMTKLLEVGAKPNEKNDDGIAAIHIACKNGNEKIADVLLTAGADPNLARGDGMMPLHIASDNGKDGVVDALIRHDADVNRIITQNGRYQGFSPLMFAARLGDAKIVSSLVDKGAQLNAAKADGFTALHLAALNGNTSACRNLILAGADYRMADETGYYPLQLATRHSQYDVVSIFLECNVEPDSCGSLGLTSLHIASFICDARLIWLLIRGGANINAVNSDDATPLHIAAGRDQGRVSMQLLLANGARMNLIDKEQDTPLHNASYRGLYQNVRLLLRRGAEPSPSNENDVTPLHLAAAVGSEETVEALLKYGANVEARDANNKTPYRVAAENNHRRAMILLFRSMRISLDQIAPTSIYANPTGSTEEVLCVICQNPLVPGEETRTLPCLHTYHNECILAWLGGENLTRHDSCPLCQQSVLPVSPPSAQIIS